MTTASTWCSTAISPSRSKCESSVGVAAVHEVFGGKAFYKCTQAWVVTDSTFTQAAVKLAAADKVRLMAGENLQRPYNNTERIVEQ